MADESQRQETGKTRPACPFYGFSYTMGIFTDTGGNQCALKTNRLSPCYMEISEQVPDWNRCPLKRTAPSDLMEKIAERRIFPNELRPEGVESWKGIRFSDWVEYIVEGKPSPIEV